MVRFLSPRKLALASFSSVMVNVRSPVRRKMRSRAAYYSHLLIAGLLMGATVIIEAPINASDWPVAAHDIRRSGSTETTLRPPFTRLWYRLFPDEGLMSGVQPVVSRDKLFVGTLRGSVYAIDGLKGSVIWKVNLPGAVLHTCAVDGERVFVPCADGALYALSAHDGTQLWRFQTGAAVWNNPLVFEGKAFFGGRDGKLYVLRAMDGEIAWEYTVDAPVVASPAIDPERRRVFFAAEDMRVYALKVDNGELLWQSERLPGVTFRGYYPVVAPDGSVMVTTTPLYSQEELQTVVEEAVRETFGDYASWRHSPEENARLREENFRLLAQPGTYQRQMELIRRKLEANPYFQTFFLLDGNTGARRGVIPIVYAESMNGTGMPPVVTPDGRVIVKFQALLRSRYQHYSPFLNVGYLDTRTGNIEPLLDETRTYGWHDSLLLVHDEQCCLGVAGTTLINTHQDSVNALDLISRRGYPEPFCWNIHEPEKGEALGIWTMLIRGESLPVGKEWILRGTGLYGGGSVIDVGITIVNDGFYYVPTHEISAGCAIIAYQMAENGEAAQKSTVPRANLTNEERDKLASLAWDWDVLSTPRIARLAPEFLELREQASQRSLSKIGPPPFVDEKFIEQVIWEVPMDSGQTWDKYAGLERELRTKLNAAVKELISRPWAPFVFPAGKHPVESYRFFADPCETLLALAYSYPYLDAEIQRDVKDWVARELQPGGSLSDIGKDEPQLDGSVPRTRYDVPRLPRLVLDDRHFNRLARLYPFWLWTSRAQDAQLGEKVKASLVEITSLAGDASDVDLGNSVIAGWIAAARFARQFGLGEVEEKAVLQAKTAIRARLDYEWQHPIDGVFAEAPRGRWVCARWRNLSPEVARLLARFARPVQEGLMERYVDHHRPTWWLAWNVELAWRNESPFSLPSMAQEIFSAKALVLQTPPDVLATWLDIPWCSADLYYIEKLAWTLQACRGIIWRPLRE
ncbi:PQQ-binding-like beta-propeller repeat protein [Thermogutta sp.]|uniref:outer membrane protein assembly factor BamB family protein n=1 Tax=Thermogutta sp. TaxID=1962930 RepID=UPI003C7E64D9